MSCFSKLMMISISIQPLQSFACDTRTIAELITGAISIGSALGALKTHRQIQEQFSEQECALAEKVQTCCAESQALVQTAQGTFLELSTYDYDEKAAQAKDCTKNKFQSLSQKGQHILSEITGPKTEQTAKLYARMQLLSTIKTYTELYGKHHVRDYYQCKPRFHVLDKIDELKDRYHDFLAQKKPYKQKILGYSLVCLVATGSTAWLMLGS